MHFDTKINNIFEGDIAKIRTYIVIVKVTIVKEKEILRIFRSYNCI